MRKPRFYDTRFGDAVRKAVDAGELTFKNIKKWNRDYNGGIEPEPAFNTEDIMRYYLNGRR